MARGNGEGTIYKRKDDRWCGQVTVGTDPKTGKQRRKTIYGDTRKEVAREMTNIKHKVFTGTYIEPAEMPYAEWYDIWIEGRKNKLSFNTYDGYMKLYKNHIKPEIGQIKLKDLDIRTLQNVINEKHESGNLKRPGGLALKTIKLIHSLIKISLDQAVKEELIIKNPANGVELPSKKKSRTSITNKNLNIWTAKEVFKFLSIVNGHKYYPIFCLALNTGLRRGEVFGLRWRNVNLKKQYLEVKEQQLYKNNIGYELIVPKTDSSIRKIPLNDDTVKVLKSHKIRQSEHKLMLGENYNDIGLVFCKEDGNHIYPELVTNHLRKVCDAHDLKRIRFHDLRHTFATLALKAGMPAKVLQAILGHSSITTTLDVYSHVLDEMKEDGVDIIQNVYRNAALKNQKEDEDQIN